MIGFGNGGIALIIPALNEAPAIGQVLERLPAEFFSQVIVVDNGSSDGTGAIAAERGAIVVREERRGYGRACQAGLRHLGAECTVVLFMDADASDDSQDIPRLVGPILDGHADLVIGARRGPRIQQGALALHQRFGNGVATGMIRWLYGFQYTDLGPFRAIRRTSLEGLSMRDPTYGWTAEMQVKALQHGLRILEVPVAYRKRIGSSKISGNVSASLAAGARILWTIARLHACRS